jgi:hypothetical protein
MNCPHAKPINASVNECALGLYGGRPSAGTCLRCLGKGENTPEFAAALFARAERSHPSARRRISGCCDRADQA